MARADELRRQYDEGAPYPRVTRLLVNQLSPSANSTEYADVGRLDWAYSARRHYVSIRCGVTKWCEIGLTYPVSSPTNLVGTPANIWTIKGWHDEQRFTLVKAGNPIPAGFRGTLVPDPQLGSRRIPQFEAGWVRVAEAYIDHVSSVYKAKLNFEKAIPGVPFPGPATARWRWLRNDEAVWTKCERAAVRF